MLSDAKVRSLKPRDRPYKLSDAEGLFVLVGTNGSRLWRWAYRFEGKQKLLALGKYPDVTLADARDRMREAKKILAQKIDPGEARKLEKRQRSAKDSNTFRAVANDWFETNKSKWTQSYASRLRARLDQDLMPRLGDRPIALIAPPEVLEAIRSVEQRDAVEMARRILQMARQIFLYGMATSRCASDPTPGIRLALRPPKPAKSRTALRTEEIPAFYEALDSSELGCVTKLALEFALLTFVRTAEIRFAEWREFEGLASSKPLWRIPSSRMKMRKEHLVPLAPRTVSLIEALRAETKSSRLVFGSTESKPMSENTMIFGLYRLGFHGKATVHGFRSTASTILNEQGFNRDWIEKQLAHEVSTIRSVYNSAEWLDGRRGMMIWWANYLERRSGRHTLQSVVGLR